MWLNENFNVKVDALNLKELRVVNMHNVVSKLPLTEFDLGGINLIFDEVGI